MFSTQRRHGKSKPLNDSPLETINNVDEIKEHHFKGLFAYFDRARRRLAKREPDTLLPTSYSATTGVSPQKIRPLTCNNFLMGGNYYPGKDKKRRHMRRKTLWYRLFCSSPGRKVASFLLVTYILFWHVLMPGTERLVQLGSQLSNSHRQHNSFWLQYDSTLKIPELAHEQLVALELAAARSRLQFQPSVSSHRFGLLESIVPAWYHRNDPPIVQQPLKVKAGQEKPPKKEAGQEKPPKKEAGEMKPPDKEAGEMKPPIKVADEMKPAIKVADDVPKTELQVPPPVIETTKKEPIAEKTREGDVTTKSRILQTNNAKVIERTIHTPIEQAGITSSCHPADADTFSTTLVTQTSLTRLWILNETCLRWKDPIVAVVYISQNQEASSVEMPSCPNLRIIQYMANDQESKSENYPVNRLRNVGLDAVTTSHVIVMDIDFVPAEGLADTVRDALKQQHQNHPDGNVQHALVIPAFERLPPSPCESDSDCARYLQTDSSFIPKTFDDLRACVGGNDCIVFQSNNNWEGHSTTMSAKWLQRVWYEDKEKTVFTKIPCFHTARYEPYVVLRWCPTGVDSKLPLAPYYDERFHGYGKNKIELISHLRKQGYRFSILPEGFIVHNPHPESTIKETWNDRKGSDLHESMDQLYTGFLNELESIYKDAHETSIKLCKREQEQ